MKKLMVVLLMFCALYAKGPVMVMETTEGTIELTLKLDEAPLACENMMKLAESGKYNNAPFHRIIPGFMIQGGDYERGNGTGGTSAFGKPFKDEFSKGLTFDKPGLLAMANAGPGTNGSQFFITTVKTSWLSGKHTIFGEVTQGYDVVKKIEALGSPSGRPQKEVKIVKIFLKE